MLTSRAHDAHSTILFLVIFCLIIPASFVIDTVDIEHFFSSHHLFEHAYLQHYRFGLDIIDNVGPYGFLHYPYTYAGHIYWSKVLWYTLLCGLYAYYAMSLTGRLNNFLEKFLFVFVITLFPLQIGFPWLSYEVIPRLVILFAALYLLSERKQHTFYHLHIITVAALYALLTLEKASNVYFAVLIMGVLSVFWFLLRRGKQAVLMLIVYTGSVIGLWLLAHQPIGGLPTYFISMKNFIDAYQSALVLDLPTPYLCFGLFYMAIAGFGLFSRVQLVYQHAERPLLKSKPFLQEASQTIIISALVFLSWKHGVLRGLASYGILWDTLIVLIVFIYYYPLSITIPQVSTLKARLFHPESSTWRLGFTLVLLLIAGVELSVFGKQVENKKGPVNEYITRIQALSDYRPWQQLHTLKTSFAELQQQYALPSALKTLFETNSVDELGESPEVLLLNPVNYKPRPVPIDFIASTPRLNQKNAAYLQSPHTAPKFVLLPEYGFHSSDTLSYLQLLVNYQTKARFKHWVVLEKKPIVQTWQFKEIGTTETKLGDWVRLADTNNTFLWLQADVKSSWLGQLKNKVYKPNLLLLELQCVDGYSMRYPISISALQAGLLINPIIRTKHELDWLDHTTSLPWREVKAFQISTATPQARWLFQPIIHTTLSAITLQDKKSVTVLDVEKAKQIVSPSLIQTTDPAPVHLPLNLLSNADKQGYCLEGVGDIEQNSTETWRWGLGPVTTLSFYLSPEVVNDPEKLVLHMSLKNAVPIPRQRATFILNGKPISEIEFPQSADQETIQATLPIRAKYGMNKLQIVYKDWNHNAADYAAHDARKLAATLMIFKLTTL